MQIHELVVSTLALLALLPVAQGQARSSGAAVPPAEEAPRLLLGPDFDARSLFQGEGELIARGSNFAAHMDADGATFETLTKRGQAPSSPLVLTLEAVGRGDALEPVAPPVLRADGLHAILERGAALEERYEVRQTGLYQSFVLGERPSGAGDLVVRLRLTTELQPSPSTELGYALDFTRDGECFTRLGEVVGIDANGARSPGRVKLIGEQLDLVLPAAFVDAAAFPLTVDPFLGSTTPLGSFGDNLFDPEVAYDGFTGHYMLVCRFQSTTYSDVDGYLFDSNLAPISSVLQIDWNTNESSRRPAVGMVRSSDRFVAAWEDGNDGGDVRIGVRSYQSSTGGASVPYFISYPQDDLQRPVVSNMRDAGSQLDRVWVVFERASGGLISIAVDAPASGPTVISALLNPLAATGERPATCRASNPGGRYAIAWVEDVGTHSRIRCTTLVHASTTTSSLQVLGPASPVSASDVAIDGNGTDFLLVWREVYLGSNTAIRAQCLHWNGSFLEEPAPPFTIASSGITSSFGAPEVAFVNNRYLITYSSTSSFSGTGDIRLVAVNPATCSVCSTNRAVGGSPGTRNDVALVGNWSGGSTLDRGLLVWDQDDGNGTRGIHGIKVEGIGGGAIIDHGGGCGSGGTLFSDDPYLGNSGYSLSLVGADSSASIALLNLRQVPSLYTCGSCSVSIALGTLETIPLASGMGTLALPIPCDPGLFGYTTHAQAIAVFPTTTSPCSLFNGISASNRLELTLGQ